MELSEKESKYFKSEFERDLWLKLNAEHQIEWEKSLTYLDSSSGTRKPTAQALHPRTMSRALEIAKNQLNHDINNPEIHNGLRYTLDEYLLDSHKELEEKRQIHFEEYWMTKFGSL